MGSQWAADGGANPGRRVIEWLRTQQLKVDPEWSVETEGGFAWWPYRDVEESEELLTALNEQLMRRPSMSGPVVAAPGAPAAGKLKSLPTR